MKTRYIIVSLLSCLGLAARAQSLELGGLLQTADGGLDGRMVIVRLDDAGKQAESLQLACYSLRDGKSTLSDEAIALQDGYYLLPIPTTLDRSFTVPFVSSGDRYAYQAKAVMADGTTLATEMIEDNALERFRWIGSDVKWTSYTTGYAPDTPRIDGSIDYKTNPFAVGGIDFYKSFSTHAKGSFTFNLPDGNPYSRLFTYYGIQDNKSQGDVRFSLIVNGGTVETHDMYSMTNTTKPDGYDGIYLRKFETTIDGKTDIVLDGGVIDNYNHDHMNFPMGRLYLKRDGRKEQTTGWPATQVLATDKPLTHTLDATFSSGGKVYYYIAAGGEYASIDNGNTLNLHTLPQDKSAYVEVVAVQPGDDSWLPSRIARCRYYVRNNKTVERDGRLVLKDGDEIDELTVYADARSCGQVVVESGLARVDKLVLKYTFTPGEWNFVSFPADASLSRISNLDALGYRLNDGQKAFYLCEYDTRRRAGQPGGDVWTRLQTDNVARNKGYIMSLSPSADNPGDKPVEVTFVLGNTTLGVDASGNGSMNVELNMMQLEPGTEFPVYVMPDGGVKGAPLKVMVRFSPDDLSALPVNHAKALEDVRVTFNPNNSGIRLTLPTQEQAKVVIFDNKERMVKAVKYVSPYLIDITGLEPGSYQLYIQYGNATATRPLEIKGKD